MLQSEPGIDNEVRIPGFLFSLACSGGVLMAVFCQRSGGDLAASVIIFSNFFENCSFFRETSRLTHARLVHDHEWAIAPLAHWARN